MINGVIPILFLQDLGKYAMSSMLIQIKLCTESLDPGASVHANSKAIKLDTGLPYVVLGLNFGVCGDKANVEGKGKGKEEKDTPQFTATYLKEKGGSPSLRIAVRYYSEEVFPVLALQRGLLDSFEGLRCMDQEPTPLELMIEAVTASAGYPG
ncbi:hypothetical protein VKT23_012560 [Stygiomarasmius scandens]|uniref:Uncharacterized protein n=1 Tax=Marasmiellus scandens TaxID=2682957 RepID=A0ABR1JA53_9AGAR